MFAYSFHSPAGISTHCCSRRKSDENVFDSRTRSTLSAESDFTNLLLCGAAFNPNEEKLSTGGFR